MLRSCGSDDVCFKSSSRRERRARRTPSLAATHSIWTPASFIVNVLGTWGNCSSRSFTGVHALDVHTLDVHTFSTTECDKSRSCSSDWKEEWRIVIGQPGQQCLSVSEECGPALMALLLLQDEDPLVVVLSVSSELASTSATHTVTRFFLAGHQVHCERDVSTV